MCRENDNLLEIKHVTVKRKIVEGLKTKKDCRGRRMKKGEILKGEKLKQCGTSSFILRITALIQQEFQEESRSKHKSWMYQLLNKKDPCLNIYLWIFFFLFGATPEAHGSSQDSGWSGGAASSLHHSHSNTRSEPYLDLCRSSGRPRILNPLTEARDQTHIFTDTYVRFLNCWATKGTPLMKFWNHQR